jgi:biotin transport system substrate-specific component
MAETSLQRTHQLVWSALFAALITAGSYLHFPIGPVPISLQVLFVLLAGFVLGPLSGFVAVGLYVLAGLAGLPVFYGGTSGLAHILGPTGGYIVGFLAAPLITGLGSKTAPAGRMPWLRGMAFAALAYVPIYLAGLAWLKASLEAGWPKVFGVGMLPFLPSDVLQVLACVATVRFMRQQRLAPGYGRA